MNKKKGVGVAEEYNKKYHTIRNKIRRNILLKKMNHQVMILVRFTMIICKRAVTAHGTLLAEKIESLGNT